MKVTNIKFSNKSITITNMPRNCLRTLSLTHFFQWSGSCSATWTYGRDTWPAHCSKKISTY